MTYLVLGFLCVMTTVAASAWEDGDPPREPHCHSRFDYEYKVSHMMRKTTLIYMYHQISVLAVVHYILRG